MAPMGFARRFATKALAPPVKVLVALLVLAAQLALRCVPHTGRKSALPGAFPSLLLTHSCTWHLRGNPAAREHFGHTFSSGLSFEWEDLTIVLHTLDSQIRPERPAYSNGSCHT